MPAAPFHALGTGVPKYLQMWGNVRGTGGAPPGNGHPALNTNLRVVSGVAANMPFKWFVAHAIWLSVEHVRPTASLGRGLGPGQCGKRPTIGITGGHWICRFPANGIVRENGANDVVT